jgi:hypothetical protein
LDRNDDPPADEGLAKARQQCLQILETFELELDECIQGCADRSVACFFRGVQASADGDQKAARRARRSQRRDWMSIYSINTRTAETLAGIIEQSCGPHLRDVWRDRYFASYYPVLYGPKSTDLIYEWLVRDVDIDAEQRAAIEVVFAHYTESRRSLRARAANVLLQLAEELDLGSPGQLAAYVSMTGEIPSAKARIDEQRRNLSQETNATFRNILTDDQRRAFDEMLARLDRGIHPFEF